MAKREINAPSPPKQQRKESQVNFVESTNTLHESLNLAQINVAANNKNNVSQSSASGQCNSCEAKSKYYHCSMNRINNWNYF